eukprot:774045_1
MVFRSFFFSSSLYFTIMSSISSERGIDLAGEVNNILLEFKPYLKWYKDKDGTKWHMVHCRTLNANDESNVKITLPQHPNKAISVPQEQLHTLRTGPSNSALKYDVLKQLLDTIDQLFGYILNKDKRQRYIETLTKEIQSQKHTYQQLNTEYTQYKLKQIKTLRTKMTELEQRFASEKSELLSRNVDMQRTNNELMKDLTKMKEQLKQQNTPKGDESDDATALYIAQLTDKKDTLARELDKCKQEHNALTQTILNKEAANNELIQELNLWRGGAWMYDHSTGTKGGDTPTGMPHDDYQIDYARPNAPDVEEEETKEEKPKKADMDIDVPALSVSKSESAMNSLNDFGHKYSTKHLNKCNKGQLVDMVRSLYADNQHLKQQLRENILGVAAEDCFLNIEELLDRYTTLRTQTHANLHNHMLNEMETKYEDDEDMDEDTMEKHSYHILFDVLYQSNVKISTHFKTLYTNMAHMIKIQDIPHSTEVVARVMHTTLQTHYKELIASRDGNDLFHLDALSREILGAIEAKYTEFGDILGRVKGDMIQYAQRCLEMVVVIKLNKPTLRFENLNEWIVSTEVYDGDKHEDCGFQYDEYDDDNGSKLFQPKYIQYYCFPGLSIANKIKIKVGKRKKKAKKKKNDYALIAKSQVVC